MSASSLWARHQARRSAIWASASGLKRTFIKPAETREHHVGGSALTAPSLVHPPRERGFEGGALGRRDVVFAIRTDQLNGRCSLGEVCWLVENELPVSH